MRNLGLLIDEREIGAKRVEVSLSPVYRMARCVCCIEGHGCRSLDRKAAGKDAERPEKQLLVLA